MVKRKCKTTQERFGKYRSLPIKLSYEGKVYQFLFDKFIDSMDKVFEEEEYKKIQTYDSRVAHFYNALSKKFIVEGKKRNAINCNSYKTLKRHLKKVIEVADKPDLMEKLKKEQERCFNIIKDIEIFFGTKLLIDTEHKKNEYIHSLIFPLINMMNDSELYSYISYRENWERMKMIENHIDMLFQDKETESYKIWQEILDPMIKIIGNGDDEGRYPGGDFPGITSTSKLWLDVNPVLEYFDCVYDVAEKKYKLYKDFKSRFNLEIGNKVITAKKNIANRKKYFESNKMNFEELFFKEFKKAYLNIAENKFQINVCEDNNL